VSGELGLRKFLERQGHTFVVTSGKDGANSVFERELPDAEIVISQPFWPAYLTADGIAKATELKLATTAGMPAHYFIDAQGRKRYHHLGEGQYDESERVIQVLLADAGDKGYPPGVVAVQASGAEVAPSMTETQSPETYIGYSRARNFVSPGGGVKDASHVYATEAPNLDQGH
jgi:hypothetical protein